MVSAALLCTLLLVSGFGHVLVAEVLLDCSWDIEAKDDEGARPLHYAAAEGHLQMIQLLLRRGAMVDCQRNHNTTPLHGHIAAKGGHAAAVSLLLSLGGGRNHQEQVWAYSRGHCQGRQGHCQDSSCIVCVRVEWSCC